MLLPSLLLLPLCSCFMFREKKVKVSLLPSPPRRSIISNMSQWASKQRGRREEKRTRAAISQPACRKEREKGRRRNFLGRENNNKNENNNDIYFSVTSFFLIRKGVGGPFGFWGPTERKQGELHPCLFFQVRNCTRQGCQVGIFLIFFWYYPGSLARTFWKIYEVFRILEELRLV